MNRQTILAFLVVVAGIGALLATTAQSQVGPPKQVVALQSTTPGTSQSGHLNVSGTIRAWQLVGGGAGVTGVNADTLDGMNSTAFMSSAPTSLNIVGDGNGPIIMGKTSNGNANAVAVQAELSDASSAGDALRALHAGSLGAAIYAETTHDSGSAFAIEAKSSSPNSATIQGFALAYTGSASGVQGASNSPSGYGVYGSSWGTGVYGFSVSTNGVFGITDSGTGNGVYGSAPHFNGSGAGVHGQANSPNAFGVRAAGTGTALQAIGTNRGIEARSTNGIAINATGGTYGLFATGGTDGIRGETSSNAHTAVFGANSGAGHGIAGVSAGGFAVYAYGNVGASGSKSFRIDHPFDPLNKYLLHYCAEGPEPMNSYSGAVTTGDDGYANVDLPDYFTEINRDPRVQLTVDDEADDFVQCKVVGGVKGNEFRIRTSKPSIKVYWRVEAVRNDRWMQTHGAPVEIEKPPHERGQYQHPELYGLPAKQLSAPKSRKP